MNEPRAASPGDRAPLRRLRLAWGAAIALGAASPLALGAQADPPPSPPPARLLFGASLGTSGFVDYSIFVRIPVGEGSSLEGGLSLAGLEWEWLDCDDPVCPFDELEFRPRAAESVAFLVRGHRTVRSGSALSPTVTLGGGPVSIRRVAEGALPFRRIGILTELGITVPLGRRTRWNAEAGVRAMPAASEGRGTRLDDPMVYFRLSYGWRFRMP